MKGITLLIGPPECGKTSLKALSGNLEKSLKMTGNITYNGYNIEDFAPQKNSAYLSQNDLHIPEMTVRETLNFSACCQGIGRRAEIMDALSRKEKEAGVVPEPDIDTFMKAISVEGQKKTLQTSYILKILGLTRADVLVENAMKRGISGGEKKRLTTEGKLVYHGPHSNILEFFESCGFRCPERKGVADFLQEVISRKDQAQYWHRTEHTHSYVSVSTFF